MSLLLLTGARDHPHAETICSEPGTLQQATFESAILGNPLDYAVYLPPCYTTAMRYPVIYLLHGSNRTHEHWPSLGIVEALDRGISAGAYPPLIVAMPHGSWIANENRFAGTLTWSSILLSEFMPHLEANYAASTDPTQRAIGGISRGGFWAYNIALRYPEQFAAVGGHSAFFDPGHFPAEYNPLDLARTAPSIDGLRLWLDRGVDDYAWYGLDLMGAALNARGIPHTYTIYPEGEHADAYWAAHLDDYLTFYTADWTVEAVELPTIAHSFDVSQGDLFLPAAAFGTLRDDLSGDRLLRVYAGTLDFDLVLDESTAAALRGHGVGLNAETRVVPDAALIETLWGERDSYTLIAFDALAPALRPLTVDGVLPFDDDLTRYPFIFEAAQPNYARAALARMLFSGVTAPSRASLPVIDANGVDWLTSGIADVTRRADWYHTSLEISFTEGCPASDEPVIGGLCGKAAHFGLFDALGTDIIELTGNHNLDYGVNAYLGTLDLIDTAGFARVGGGATLDEARQPLTLDTAGGRVALLACNWNGPDYALATVERPGAAFCTLDWLRETIPALAADHDLVIVTVQYAEYNQRSPIQRQQNHLRTLADLGADVIIGTQAHIPQAFEFYPAADGRMVFIHYGLGNLFFDQTGPGFVDFFMDELLIYEGRLLGVHLLTGTIEERARPRWMTADERADLLRLTFEASGFNP
ncbi:MAG: CapA family protein [Chloroflexota bacterium]